MQYVDGRKKLEKIRTTKSLCNIIESVPPSPTRYTYTHVYLKPHIYIITKSVRTGAASTWLADGGRGRRDVSEKYERLEKTSKILLSLLFTLFRYKCKTCALENRRVRNTTDM